MVLVCFDIEFEMEQQVRVDNLAPLVVEVDEVCILEAAVVALWPYLSKGLRQENGVIL